MKNPTHECVEARTVDDYSICSGYFSGGPVDLLSSKKLMLLVTDGIVDNYIRISYAAG